MIPMALLLMVGCKDIDENHMNVSDGQYGSEMLIAETSSLQMQPEEFINNIYDGMIVTDKPWDGLSTAALGVFHLVGKLMDRIFDNFINEKLPVLDKQFKAETGQSGQEGRCWQIESYSFNYRSKSARGEDVVLSGRVTFPNSKTKGTVRYPLVYWWSIGDSNP